MSVPDTVERVVPERFQSLADDTLVDILRTIAVSQSELADLEALATADAIVERIRRRPRGMATDRFADRDAFRESPSFW